MKILDAVSIVSQTAEIDMGTGSVSGHCLKVYQEKFGYKNSDLPVSHRLNSQELALPLYADMTQEGIKMYTTEFHKMGRYQNLSSRRVKTLKQRNVIP